MKIESISIQNFKLFENFELSFKNKTLQEVSNRFLILGDNGTGKTSLLQAIALPLALATRSGFARSIPDFDWPGFLPGRLFRNSMPRIELEVSFKDEEIQATREVAFRWHESLPDEIKTKRPFAEPADKKLVRVVLNGEHLFVGDDIPGEQAMFLGRHYAQKLLRTDPSVRSQFLCLPGIFWFDQLRNLGSNPYSDGNSEREHISGISFKVGVERLRNFLIDWQLKQESGRTHNRNFLKELEMLYKKIFLGRSFGGVQCLPSLGSPTEAEFYFLLDDGKHKYDIVEMSSGEQSVFPILYEIVRQQIAYSVVLIDEIDLNLHPPAAQSLVSQLFKIAPHCQYIITTHSEAVSDIIRNDHIFRMEGGALCL
ncbi:MAG: AAA family ATPase [Deltaproteobacteria bacterium]|nr:MAG: AAA family ATPase [Deltaproteobacteria bacterium]